MGGARAKVPQHTGSLSKKIGAARGESTGEYRGPFVP